MWLLSTPRAWQFSRRLRRRPDISLRPNTRPALVRTEPLIDRGAEPRLWYKHRANLVTNYSLVDRHREAEILVEQVKPLAQKLGDELDLHGRWFRVEADQGASSCRGGSGVNAI